VLDIFLFSSTSLSLLFGFSFRIQHWLHACLSWIIYKMSLNSPLLISFVIYCLVQWLWYVVNCNTDSIAAICKTVCRYRAQVFKSL